MARARSEDMKTPLVRLAYADGLFKARSLEEGKKPQFGCTLLIPKSTDLNALRQEAQKVAIAEWGEAKAKKLVENGLLKSPFLDGDGPQAISRKSGERHAGHEGHWFLRVSRQESQGPVRAYDEKVLPAGPDVIYSGCYGYAVVNCYAWENDKGGVGISFGISMFQKVKDGDRLGGGGPANPDKFFDKVDTGDAPDTKGAGAESLFA